VEGHCRSLFLVVGRTEEATSNFNQDIQSVGRESNLKSPEREAFKPDCRLFLVYLTKFNWLQNLTCRASNVCLWWIRKDIKVTGHCFSICLEDLGRNTKVPILPLLYARKSTPHFCYNITDACFKTWMSNYSGLNFCSVCTSTILTLYVATLWPFEQEHTAQTSNRPQIVPI
jgi:hypothetical protein